MDVKSTLLAVDQLIIHVPGPVATPNIIVYASKFVPGAKPDVPDEERKSKKAKTSHVVNADNAAIYPPPPPAGATYASQGYPKSVPSQHVPSSNGKGNAVASSSKSAAGGATGAAPANGGRIYPGSLPPSKTPTYRTLPDGAAASKGK